MSNLVDLSNVDEYTRRRIQRDLAAYKEDEEAAMTLLKKIWLTNVCCFDDFISSPVIYEAFEEYFDTFPNIKAARRRKSIFQNLKEKNCTNRGSK